MGSPEPRDRIYGHRARIGYTSPPLTTEVFPYEFYKIVPSGVTLVLTTLAIVVRSGDEIERSYDISMKAVREMAAAGVDIAVLGGVPINVSKGYANAEQMIGELETKLKVKVSTSASAQAKAIKALGCKKVVVAQPYELSETDRIAGYGTHFGCEVLGATGWGSAFNQIGRIPRHAALEMGRKLMREHPAADSILLPSPHWPTAESIDALEREFGVNVVAAHQAIVWDALRRCALSPRSWRSLHPDGSRPRRRSRSSSRSAFPIPSTRCSPGTWPATPASTRCRGSRSRSST